MPDGKYKILMVDDDEMLLSSFSRTLGRHFRLTTVASAEEALKLVGNTEYAVVVSDIMMPGMSGLEFLAKLKELSPDTVRIVLTGVASASNAIEAINSGYVFRFKSKPISAESMRETIDEGIRHFALIKGQAEMQGLLRLKDAMEGIIQGFSALVEARDPYTAGHQRSVTNLGVAIGRILGMDEDKLQGLRMAGLVHDIGKLYVPSIFLNKPGKLSEAEFHIIKMHPLVGYDILKSIDFPWPVSDIVVQHHERLDGSGYPAGLSGEAILIEAKILAVADVYDAMANHRPYRPALGPDRAIQELKKMRGIYFDPDVVEALLKKRSASTS